MTSMKEIEFKASIAVGPAVIKLGNPDGLDVKLSIWESENLSVDELKGFRGKLFKVKLTEVED